MKKLITALMAMLLVLTMCCSAFAEELPDASNLTIAGIIHTEDYFGQMMAAGMQAAADDTGAYMYRGCTSMDSSKEFELIQTYISMDVDAIVASPTGNEGSNATYKSADAQGVKVVYINSVQDVNESTMFLNGQYSSNNYTLASTAAEYAVKWMQENMPGEKIVLATTGVMEGSTTIDQRHYGFTDTLDAAGVDYEEVARGYGYVQDTMMQVVGDMLTANPDINVIWCDCDGAAIGAVMAIKAAGLEDEVKVFTIDIGEQVCDMLCEENPVLIAAAGQDGYQMGYEGMMMAIRVCLGLEEGTPEPTYVDAKLLTCYEKDAVADYKLWLQELAG